MHLSSFLMLPDAGDCGLGMRREDTGLRVDHPQGAKYECLVLRGGNRWYSGVPRERRCTNISMTKHSYTHLQIIN